MKKVNLRIPGKLSVACILVLFLSLLCAAAAFADQTVALDPSATIRVPDSFTYVREDLMTDSLTSISLTCQMLTPKGTLNDIRSVMKKSFSYTWEDTLGDLTLVFAHQTESSQRAYIYICFNSEYNTILLGMAYNPSNEAETLITAAITATISVSSGGSSAPEPAPSAGLRLDDDGIWRYYENGAFVEKTGIVDFNGGRFFVANGLLCSDANGLAEYGGQWYFLAGGQIQTQYTGLALYDDHWFYLVNGLLDTNLNGLVDYDGSKFIVAAGQLIRGVDGLWQNTDGTWYFLADSQVVTYYTGMAEYDGNWFYIIDGRLATEFTGNVAYGDSVFYVVNGQAVSNADQLPQDNPPAPEQQPGPADQTPAPEQQPDPADQPAPGPDVNGWYISSDGKYSLKPISIREVTSGNYEVSIVIREEESGDTATFQVDMPLPEGKPTLSVNGAIRDFVFEGNGKYSFSVVCDLAVGKLVLEAAKSFSLQFN